MMKVKVFVLVHKMCSCLYLLPTDLSTNNEGLKG